MIGLRVHLGRDDVHGEVTPAGELVFRVGEELLSLTDDGRWAITTPRGPYDVVTVLSEARDVERQVVVMHGGDPDAN